MVLISGGSRATEVHDYRADIDGLRALAVLAVVFYHAFPSDLPGGFVGVDVFFVISGYLITGLLESRLDSGHFSVADFYARRARRIFPALATVLATTWAIGHQVLFAEEFAQLGRHLAAGAGFIANLVLYGESGYFDVAAETKPLLHLWSLGIEEQFYLFWPLVLAWAFRARWRLTPVVVALCAASFAANLWTVGKQPVLAFYAPWTRCWELFAGALVALGGARSSPKRLRLPGQSVLGTLLLGAAVVAFSPAEPFPGWRAALPVLGAVLLIAAGPDALVNRWLLARSVLVGIGLISYPLYLWHWPLLAYARILGHQQVQPAWAWRAVFAAMVLAWLTWRLVERPLRAGAAKRGRLAALSSVMLALLVTGLVTDLSGGLRGRAVVTAMRANDDELLWHAVSSKGCEERLGVAVTFCYESLAPKPPRVMVIGDSTANALSPGLGEALGARGVGLLSVSSFGCPPLRGLIAHADWRRGEYCMEGNERAFELVLSRPEVDLVVLAWLAWNLDIWGLPGVSQRDSKQARFAVAAELLEREINALHAAGKRVVVSYDVPYLRVPPSDCLPRPLATWFGTDFDACAPRDSELLGREPYLALFDRLMAAHPEVCVFSQSRLLVPDGRLRVTDEQGVLLMRDDHHLSHNGSRRMARRLLEQCAPDLLAPSSAIEKRPSPMKSSPQ